MIRQILGVVITLLATVSSARPQLSTGAPTDPAGSNAAQQVKPVTFDREGLLFSTGDEALQLRVHGYLQGEAELFQSNLTGQSPDELFWRRIRPLFEASLFKTLDFRLMPDFGMNTPVVQEVYAELRVPSIAKLRVGKFKTPIGLENLRSDRELTFVERSLASDLVPVRDLGAQVSGAVLQGTVNYAVGYFNGARDASNANFEWTNSGEGVMRVFAEPFASTQKALAKGVGVGVAGSTGYTHGPAPSFKTMGLNTFFKYSSGTSAGGDRQRLSPQAYYYYGPVGVLGEYVISSQVLRHEANTRRTSNRAWQLAGSVVLTGEKNSYGGVRPAHGFEPQKGLHYLGTWEVAARYSTLKVDPSAFPVFANPAKSPDQAKEWVVGLNWYLNRYAKLMVDWEHTSFAMISPKFTPLHSESVVVPRLQLQF